MAADVAHDAAVPHREDRLRDQRPTPAQARLRGGRAAHPAGPTPRPQGGNKLSFTADQRRRLATAGKLLSADERRKCCRLVKPATILAWFREMAARKYDSSEARRGRPGKPKDVRKLVIKLAMENRGWGYTKIRDALRTGLAVEIGRTTVANILAEAGIKPAPEREKTRTWKQFLKAHWERHLRYVVREFIAHYHRERFHQGLGGQLIERQASSATDKRTSGKVVCRSRLGGILNSYHREAA